MTDEPFVYIIVLNYNGTQYLRSCLSSLEQQTYRNYKIIVFDNASTDNSVALLQKEFPSVIMIASKENYGFAKGNNLAMQFALNQKADYVFLVNNDTESQPDLLEKLVNTAESNAQTGIVAPVVYDLADKRSILEMGMTMDRFGYPLTIKKPAPEKKCFFVSGCAMLIKSEVLKKLGLFDEKYFMFAEDLDLCWRAWLGGYKLAVNQKAGIYHAGGGSILGGVIKTSSYTTNARRIFLREKNTIRTLIKNYSISNIARVVPFYVSLLVAESFFWICAMQPRIAKKIFKAILWNITVLPDTFKERAIVQNLRQVDDAEIISRMRGSYGKLHVFKLVGVPNFVNSD